MRLFVLTLLLSAQAPIDATAPLVSGGVAAPMSSDVEREVPEPTVDVAEPEDEPQPAPIDTDAPRDVAGAARVALLVAGLLRGLIWLLRQPMLGALWQRLPLAARMGALGLFTAGAAAADAVATGVNWPTAVMTAIFGASGAIASHELQTRVVPRKVKPS